MLPREIEIRLSHLFLKSVALRVSMRCLGGRLLWGWFALEPRWTGVVVVSVVGVSV